MRLLLLTLVSLLTLAWPGDAPRPDQAPGAAARPPNFIIIYADDLGYADIGPFSTKSGDARPRTPNLDRMAAEGIRLTNFYVAQAVCSASRAALLTGAYSNRVGIQGGSQPHGGIWHQSGRNDHRRSAQAARLRHGHLWEVASRSSQAVPARAPWLR